MFAMIFKTITIIISFHYIGLIPLASGDCNGIRYRNSNKFIDLTYALNNNTMRWPTRKIKIYTETEQVSPYYGTWIASRGFCVSEHTSTHIDAPYHTYQSGRKLHDVPLEDLIEVPGVMMDIYDKVYKYKNGVLEVIENYVLTREDIFDWEKKHGTVTQGSVVLLRTGWGSRWGNLSEYIGDSNVNWDTEGTDDQPPEVHANFPGFDSSAATFLSEERQVRGVGIDTFSIDSGNSKTIPAHRIFGRRGVYMLENVANLHTLPPRDFDLWIVPFKVDDGTGAPTRVLARLR